MRKTSRKVLHKQRRRTGSYTVLSRGENVTLEVVRGTGKDMRTTRTRTGQGTSGYYRALWEGEAALSFGKDRGLLEWNG